MTKTKNMRAGMWSSLVMAPALGAGYRRFESGHPDHLTRTGLIQCVSVLFSYKAHQPWVFSLFAL